MSTIFFTTHSISLPLINVPSVTAFPALCRILLKYYCASEWPILVAINFPEDMTRSKTCWRKENGNYERKVLSKSTWIVNIAWTSKCRQGLIQTECMRKLIPTCTCFHATARISASCWIWILLFLWMWEPQGSVYINNNYDCEAGLLYLSAFTLELPTRAMFILVCCLVLFVCTNLKLEPVL